MSDVATSTRVWFLEGSSVTLTMGVTGLVLTAGGLGRVYRTILNPAFSRLSKKAYNKRGRGIRFSYGVYQKAFSSHLVDLVSKLSAALGSSGSKPLSMTTLVILRKKKKSLLRTGVDSLRTLLGKSSSVNMDLTIITTLNALDVISTTPQASLGLRVKTQHSFEANSLGSINNA